ncbi:MarR family winged helix-turn-helix transcriptional regulator [uncultured Jatrophihabitans sp.]|uniref:MarR family winged helix-turn-helix transcriptional regulator n=1 Tax=uncultured Jatrophihabitans sp. TaxID=1610747 RepID=UPI0035C9C818
MRTRQLDVGAFALTVEGLVRWLREALPGELSSSTVATLGRLDRDGPIRVSDLARLERMTQPGVTVLVNRLAGSGLAERTPDPTDGRAALVRITPAGRALIAKRRQARVDALRHRLDELPAADQELILAALPALDRLIDHRPQPRQEGSA